MTTFYDVLDHVRAMTKTEADKGKLFERVMKAYFKQAPLYKSRFKRVMLWSEWRMEVEAKHGEDMGPDRGVDLVAEERDGGYCAIQAKCYAADTAIAKKHVDSFLAEAGQTAPRGGSMFQSGIFISTGKELGPHAQNSIRKNALRTYVMHSSELAADCADWPDLSAIDPDAWRLRIRKFDLRDYQEKAIRDIKAKMQAADQGQLIMACGTGKTFTALRLAESMAGAGKRVLFLAPSINLVGQTMREWGRHASVQQRLLCVCSDTSTGKDEETGVVEDLEIPPTTDAEALGAALRQRKAERMTVVFSTYQSTPVIQDAQTQHKAPQFDLILCDEAHRTAGADIAGDAVSPMQLVHHKNLIRGRKRLYMTATPKVYGALAKQKAKTKAAADDGKRKGGGAKRTPAALGTALYSMDDHAVFGEEMYKMTFSDAISAGWLSDYEVHVLCVDAGSLPDLVAKSGGAEKELSIDEASMLVGAWRAMQHPGGDKDAKPLRRAIAYTSTIAMSKRLAKFWSVMVQQAADALTDPDERAGAQRFAAEHTDGKQNALQRKDRIVWLGEAPPEGESRVLCNAKCLQEGVDIPALDAAIFVNPKRSPIDIAQAVGRVMRKTDSKAAGHILIPVAVPNDAAPDAVLNDNARFKKVWAVVRALRSHDDRLDLAVNRIHLEGKLPDNFSVHDLRKRREERARQREQREQETARQAALPFGRLEVDPNLICAKLVDKCGDREYWKRWGKDVADVFDALKGRVRAVLANDEDGTLRSWFAEATQELKASLNESVTDDNAIEMLAQHIITKPVFDALFKEYDFAAKNPLSEKLEVLRQDFMDYGLDAETRHLEPFYDSIRKRVEGLESATGRQRVLLELYDTFFKHALPKESDRNGVVYTPPEVVDFILHSADAVLRDEFGRALTAKDVHILDPFAGTGVFPARLLANPELIRKRDLTRKFKEELHANEIMLLSYYLATVAVEEAYYGRHGGEYAPFEGAVLTDTFNLNDNSKRGLFKNSILMGANNERAERQGEKPIKVIVGNPPYSAGQKSSADDNQNVVYPALRARIADTYAKRSETQLLRSLYDSYKQAFRWATDRLGDEGGVIAFVSNGSWIDGNADAGLRACLAEEFTSIHVFNLRGDQRTQGERSKQEGGKIFGSGSRTPVAITILVRNPNAKHKGCRILYKDIGDYLERRVKLRILEDAKSIRGVEDWVEIQPNTRHDWINQRGGDFDKLMPLGDKTSKARQDDVPLFQLYSNGYKTSRDAYLYNFSAEDCALNARKAVRCYRSAAHALRQGVDVAKAAKSNSEHIRWDRELKNALQRGRVVKYGADRICEVPYRPFVPQRLYVDYALVNGKYQMDRVFPWQGGENTAICVPGVGSTKGFSVLAVDAMPDLELISKGQCFPRYRYDLKGDVQQSQLDSMASKPQRIDNITDAALAKFRERYADKGITKDAIFDYIYGILHSPEYRERFANNLRKELPRIPFAPDFQAFAEAGGNLMKLHLNYETCKQHPLRLVFAGQGKPQNADYKIGRRKMHYADKAAKNAVVLNERIRLEGIPDDAHQYVVNGRTPIEWLMDRYLVKTDKKSGIVNDPNGWFKDNPAGIVEAFKRVTHVSLETVKIVKGLAGMPIGC